MSSADENIEKEEKDVQNSNYPDVDSAQTDSELLDLLDSVVEDEEEDSDFGIKNPSMENDYEMDDLGEVPDDDLIDIFGTEETEESGMEEEDADEAVDIFGTGETEESGMEEEETDEVLDIFGTEETEESGMEEEETDEAVDIFGTEETEESGMEEEDADEAVDIFGTEETEESGMEEEDEVFDIFGTEETEESGMEEEDADEALDIFGTEETEASGMEEEETGLDKEALEEQFEFISEDGGTIEGVEIREETPVASAKEGLFSKLIHKVFPKKQKVEHPENETLDEENAGVIKEIEEEEPDQPVEPVKEKKKKEKKAKKGKKAAEPAAEEGESETGEAKGKKGKQEKKPKKEKKERVKKEKKKKEREPEEPSAPLPKLPVIIIFVLCISFGVFLILAQKLTFYGSTINKARERFIYQDYQGAYEQLMGMEIKEADQELYDQTVMMQKMNQRYESYLAYIELGEYDHALNELVYAVSDYDEDIARVKELGIETEYSAMFDQIQSSLENIFSASLEDARNWYQIDSQKDYTLAIRSKIQELGFGTYEELDSGRIRSDEEEQKEPENPPVTE